jgi:hypothetical protein
VRLEYLLFRALLNHWFRKDLPLLFPILSILVPSRRRGIRSSSLKNSNPIIPTLSGGAMKIRSSAWLEHYTDNVGVSSSNLLGSTNKLLAASC